MQFFKRLFTKFDTVMCYKRLPQTLYADESALLGGNSSN